MSQLQTQESETDLISKVALRVEKINKSDALVEAKDLADSIEENYFKLGGLLKVIHENSWFDGYESFGEYVYETFGFQERKARYLMEIYSALVDKQIPWEKVAHLGWTKLKDLAKVLDLENLDYWVERAEMLSVAELAALLKKGEQGEGGSEKTTDNTATMKFKLHEDQVETVTSALNKAKVEVDTDFDNVALEMICANFLQEEPKSAPSLKEAMSKAGYEQVFELIGELFPELDVTVEH